MKSIIAILFVLSVIVLQQLNQVYSGRKYVSNLSAACLKCLCYASTNCNMTVGCQNDYCGPFFLNREHWREAQRPVLKDDDPDRTNAFIDCVRDYECASETLVNYLAKYAYDCNNNGVTDCDDYAGLLFHGKNKCSLDLSSLNSGRRYTSCKPTPTFPNNNQG